MLGREQGIAYHEAGKDVWSQATNSCGQTWSVSKDTLEFIAVLM
jgi:hypothetical protein